MWKSTIVKIKIDENGETQNCGKLEIVKIQYCERIKKIQKKIVKVENWKAKWWNCLVQTVQLLKQNKKLKGKPLYISFQNSI